MKKILAALMLCAACETAFAQTAEELLADGKNTENVTTFGMGYDLKMYSPLKQINKSNVKRLVPVWAFSLANDMGELSQPTIYDGVMYVVNGNWTFAIDVATGRQISKSKTSPGLRKWWVNQGPVIAMFCAATAALNSASPGLMTLRISSRGTLSGMDAVSCGVV